MNDRYLAFVAGQVWRYRTRPGEEESRAIIGKVEVLELGIRVIHVKLTGLRVVNLGVPDGFSSTIPHVPVAEESFRASVTQPTNEQADLTDFAVGYETWQEHRGGVFTVLLVEIPELVEKALREPGHPL